MWRGVLAVAILAGSVVCCAALGMLAYVPERELVDGFRGIFGVFAGGAQLAMVVSAAAAAIVAIAFTGLFASRSYSNHQVGRLQVEQARALALAAQRDAQLMVTVAGPGEQVYTHQLGGSVAGRPIYHQPLHLAPGRVNGELQADPAEVQRWGFYQLAQSAGRQPAAASLPLADPTRPALPEWVDLAHYVAGGASLRSIFLGIGRLPDGRVQPVSAPLESLVHIGAGGAPGFGKSTFMQAVAWQVLNARERPQVVMLDPQAVTFSIFAGDERLRYMASEPGDIAAVLADLVKEMQRRQQLFGRWRGIQNLGQYNQAVEPAERLAPIPVFFDEFGLVADNKQIVTAAKKLSQGGRKAGISLVVGTQHWGHSEVSTAFRGDLSTRVQFHTRDKSDSRILLGSGAAADITRKGQAFAVLPGQPGLIELQAPDPGSLTGVSPELLPETAGDPLADLKDRLDGEDAESSPDFVERVIELWQETGSFRAVARQMFGYTNGAKIEQVKQILADSGIIG